MKFTVIHTELANKNANSLCALSAIEYIDNEIQNKYSWNVKPPSDSYKLNKHHGLTYDDLNKCPDLTEVWNDIFQVIENKTIIAFIANNQIRNIMSSFKHYQNLVKYPHFKDAKMPVFDFFCLFHMYHETYLNSSNNLLNLCETLSYPVNPKSCLSMAEACGFLTVKLLNDLKINDFMEIKHKLNVSLGERFNYRTEFPNLVLDFIPCLPKLEENPYFSKIELEIK